MNKSELKIFIKEEIRKILREDMPSKLYKIEGISSRKILREDMPSKLYKIEGLLVTNTKKKTQTQVLSDIRSITGVTTIDTRDYEPNFPKPGYLYDIVTIKIDPYPYIKFGKFDVSTLNQIIDNINKIRGVVKFKVENPQLINIGV